MKLITSLHFSFCDQKYWKRTEIALKVKIKVMIIIIIIIQHFYSAYRVRGYRGTRYAHLCWSFRTKQDTSRCEFASESYHHLSSYRHFSLKVKVQGQASLKYDYFCVYHNTSHIDFWSIVFFKVFARTDWQHDWHSGQTTKVKRAGNFGTTWVILYQKYVHWLHFDWQVVYASAVQSFSDLTSASVALYHKVAQLLLIENNGNPLLSYKFRALSLVG